MKITWGSQCSLMAKMHHSRAVVWPITGKKWLLYDFLCTLYIYVFYIEKLRCRCVNKWACLKCRYQWKCILPQSPFCFSLGNIVSVHLRFPTVREGITAASSLRRADAAALCGVSAGKFVSLLIFWRRYHSMMSHPARHGLSGDSGWRQGEGEGRTWP